MKTLPDEQFLTVAEVADVLRVSKMTIYRMVNAGTLPAVRINSRSVRIPVVEAKRLLEPRPGSASPLVEHFDEAEHPEVWQGEEE